LSGKCGDASGICEPQAFREGMAVIVVMKKPLFVGFARHNVTDAGTAALSGN